jgi:hypothetical protein
MSYAEKTLSGSVKSLSEEIFTLIIHKKQRWASNSQKLNKPKLISAPYNKYLASNLDKLARK